jgi:hypothetical protein
MMAQATERAACKVCGAFYCPAHLLGGDDKQQVVRKAIAERDAMLSGPSTPKNCGDGCHWPRCGCGLPTETPMTEMKRYDFDWGYVGIEQHEREDGEWVRYVDALAHYSKELDQAYAEGRKDERERCEQICAAEQAENREMAKGSTTPMYDWMADGAGLCLGAIRSNK